MAEFSRFGVECDRAHGSSVDPWAMSPDGWYVVRVGGHTNRARRLDLGSPDRSAGHPPAGAAGDSVGAGGVDVGPVLRRWRGGRAAEKRKELMERLVFRVV